MSGSGISWAVCKSAPCSRQITTPAPHHCFYRPDALPVTQPTASKHRRHYTHDTGNDSEQIQLAQCRFIRPVISNAKMLIYVKSNIYGRNFIKQQSETAIVCNYQNADCSLRKKNYCVIYCNFRHTFVPCSRHTVNNSYRLRQRGRVSAAACLFPGVSRHSHPCCINNYKQCISHKNVHKR